ncbi:MAG: ATP synthase subunit I [Pseudomonadales bacterium]|nr:ATP synthase subunit I [Pseudomonadales bacterium]
MSLPYRIVTLQLLAAVTAAAGLLIWDGSQAFAALLAGVVCLIPGGFFAWRADVERSPAKLLKQGVFKFALTIVLLALAIALFKPAAAGFFGTFALLQAMYVVGPLLAPIAGRH